MRDLDNERALLPTDALDNPVAFSHNVENAANIGAAVFLLPMHFFVCGSLPVGTVKVLEKALRVIWDSKMSASIKGFRWRQQMFVYDKVSIEFFKGEIFIPNLFEKSEIKKNLVGVKEGDV